MAKPIQILFGRNANLTTEQVIRKKTIWAFFFFFLFIAGCVAGWRWLRGQEKESEMMGALPIPVRNALDINGKLFSRTYSPQALAPTYPVSKAVKNVRVNGDIGLKSQFDSAAWRLIVVKKNGDSLKLTMDDIRKLPKTDIVFNFKCIEGWSQITHWAGVKVSDFAKAYGLGDEISMSYAGLSTPDGEYYVGIDMPSFIHPQTLLCYEMNDKPLPLNQGYPLRLIIPVKYGIKHLKRIGSIYFSNKRPKDFWAERGYDYYSGL
jgi:DMSO/TMAO reductase YedYZ molybdopterin-dependent catalytic subunit